jgi:hypothetical protein
MVETSQAAVSGIHHREGGASPSYVPLSLRDSVTRYLTSGFFINSLLPMIINDIFSKIFMKIVAAQGAPSVSQHRQKFVHWCH